MDQEVDSEVQEAVVVSICAILEKLILKPIVSEASAAVEAVGASNREIWVLQILS